MTTVIVTKNKILSDGLVSIGSRIDDENFNKVRKIGGYLVGGAGRLSSVLTFFSWYEQKIKCDEAQQVMEGLVFDHSSDKEDDEFIAVVVHPDGQIFFHEGNDPSRAYPLNREFYAIGSGADFAMGALEGGCTPEEAMKVAKKLDVYSGGATFMEELDPMPEAISEEALRGMKKEQLLNLILTGNPDGESESNSTEE